VSAVSRALLLACGAALLACMPAVRASAQVTLNGRVTLIEPPGKNGRDVKTAVVWLVPVDAPYAAPDTVARRAAIAMRTREFLPRVRVIAAGGSVEFPNQDPFSHNVFSNSELGRFDLGLYRRRDTRSATFPKPGVYAVYCNIHARMASFVVAVPGRHVAMVDAAGAFVFRDVMPGTYELHGWHERASETSKRIVVSPTETVVTVSLDARGYVPGPHLNKFGQPYATTRADRYE
jgi:plastocyanin